MLTREISYEDFNGDQVTEKFYFNISQAEVAELELTGEDGSYGTYLQNIIRADDRSKLFAEFKRLILMAHGEKTADGKRFVKPEDGGVAFSQTAAYDSLFMELVSDHERMAQFIKAVFPKELSQPDQDKPLPPPASLMSSPSV